MVVAARSTSLSLTGVSTPRIAPPVPATSKIEEYETAAAALGIQLYPWQKVAARYITAVNRDQWKFREVCVVVARQNGKTELLIPRVLMGLESGESILHTAQNRDIPRKTFLRIAGLIASHPTLNYSIRKANGQEEIVAPTGGRYKLVAPNASSRGETADLVLIDEVRQQRDLELMDAMLPTTTARPNSQTIYLSNAGDDQSVVLNSLKRRSDNPEPEFAYLEWSAAPDLPIGDRYGWAQANPAMGHGGVTLDGLEYFFRARSPETFETEHLCRWVESMQPRLISEAAWLACESTLEATPVKPAIGFNVDPSGKRASIVMAWAQTDGRIAVTQIEEAEGKDGESIDLPSLGARLKELAAQYGVKQMAFAPWTDKTLAAYVPKARPMEGKEFANACENFVRLIMTGRLAWEGENRIAGDLTWTARKPHESGAWQAVPATPERSVTAVLAAIRATRLASLPKAPVPRIG